MNNQLMSPLLQSPLRIEYALLGFVWREPLHGYEIHRRLTETPELRLIWRMKQSRLYAILTRLEDEGLLRAVVEARDARPPRKVYHLTRAGESAFRRWTSQPVALPREMRLEFMLKLYFAAEEDPEAVTSLIRRQQAVCDQWLAAQSAANAARPFIRVVRSYRRSHIEAIRDWLASLPADFVENQPAIP
jgi:DNA-binding PadR family transcriptional regulator